MTLIAPPILTDIVHITNFYTVLYWQYLDSPGRLPYTEICGNSILTWTVFLNLLLIIYYGGGWFMVHDTDDDDCTGPGRR